MQNLTLRQLEVLRLVATGMTNKAIAFNLGLSPKTVEKHLSIIFKKLKVQSRTEAAVIAVKAGFIKGSYDKGNC